MELLAERKYAKLYRSSPFCVYEFKEPELTDEERELVGLIRNTSIRSYSFEELQLLFMKDKSRENYVEQVMLLLEQMREISKSLIFDADSQARVCSLVSEFLDDTGINLANRDNVIRTIMNDVIGLGFISYLLDDDEIEEIMVNGAGKPVFIFDRQHGLCTTNLSFEHKEQVYDIISRIAKFVHADVTKDCPMLDARLPDGSRVNATVPPASPYNPTLTIRKFRKRPVTVTEMIWNGTLSAEAIAFLWLCVDGLEVSPLNMIIAGGTGSGKTMLLNALNVFVPDRERIISIEDTLEINLFNRENWVQLETRADSGFSMDDLLKNSLRMRPDRILVGEVRGTEAFTMFTAMDIGHQGLMCTMHANSARETVMRLQAAPMNIPTSLFPLLDIIIMEHRMYWPRKGLIRRVTQISEVSVMDDTVLLNDLFTFNRENDKVERTNMPSRTFEKLAFLTGLKIDDIKKELESRTQFLESLVEDKIFDYGTIKKAVLDYRRVSLGEEQD